MLAQLACMVLAGVASWVICGLLALIVMRILQAVDPTIVVKDTDVNGTLLWGLFSLACAIIVALCKVVYPLSRFPGWFAKILGLTVTKNAPSTVKGFYGRYLGENLRSESD